MVVPMNGARRVATEAERESTLAKEIDDFKREKERIRAIVGRIGGAPTFRGRLFNILFGAAIALCFIVSLATQGRLVLPMIEIGVALISVKIIYLLHTNARQMHFIFWVLSSLEWRLNEIEKELKEK